MARPRAAAHDHPPDDERDARARPEPAPQPILPRLLLLLVWLVALDLWAVHHLGIGLSSPGWLSAVVVAYSAASGLLESLVEEEEKERWTGKVRAFLRRALSLPVIVVLCLSLAIFALSYSSVMVVSADGDGAEKGVRLTPLSGEERPWRVGDPERLLAYTGPFGQPFRLEVPGYLPTVVQVPALKGLRVVPERDLRRPPTLLLRPPGPALGSLADQGAEVRIEVQDESGGWASLASARCYAESCRPSSFLVGRPQRVPSDLLGDWRLELLATGYQDSDPQLSEALLAWKRPKPLRSSRDLAPGTVVRAEVRSRSGEVVARTRLTVGEEDFLDVPMTMNEE